MAPLPRPDSFELADYTSVLRRRAWLIVVATLLGVAAAGAYIVVGPKSYTATAAVAVTAPSASGSQQPSAKSGPSATVNMDNDAQIVQSANVAAGAQRLMHVATPPAALVKDVSVTVPANTQVLDINCKAHSGELAAQCANAFAHSFLSYQATLATSTLQAQLDTLASKMRTLEADIVRLRNQLKRLRLDSPLRYAPEIALSSDQSQLSALDAQVAPLTAQEADASGGSVITLATPPASPSSPRKLLIGPSGLMAGLVIGLAGAFLLDRRDRRVHDGRELERHLGLPVLLGPFPRGPSPQVALAPPRSPAGHAFTDLAHTVAAALGQGNHVLAVAGTNRRTAGSMVAANVAAALARTHAEVVLVCADLDGTVVPQMFGLAPGRGLAELVAGRAAAGDVAGRPADVPRLRVIGPGLETDSTLYHLQHDRSERLVTQLRSNARYVVIEINSAGDEADTFSLAEFCDAAVLAVETTRTSRDDVEQTLRRLDRLRTTVLGAALLPPLAGVSGPPPSSAPTPRPLAAPPGPDQPDREYRSAKPVKPTAQGGSGHGGHTNGNGGNAGPSPDGEGRPANGAGTAKPAGSLRWRSEFEDPAGTTAKN